MRVPKIGTPLVNLPQAYQGARQYNTHLGTPRESTVNSVAPFMGSAKTWSMIGQSADSFKKDGLDIYDHVLAKRKKDKEEKERREKEMREAAGRFEYRGGGFYGGYDPSKPFGDPNYEYASQQEKIAEQEANTVALSTYSAFSGELDGYLNSEKGLFATSLGAASFGATDQAKTHFDKRAEALSANMDSQAAGMFNAKVDEMRPVFLGAVSRFEGGQRREAYSSALQTALETNAGAAKMAWGDDFQWHNSLRKVEVDAFNLARAQNLGPEDTWNLRENAVSQLNGWRVRQYAESGDYNQAFELWNSAEMTPEARTDARFWLAESYSSALKKNADPTQVLKTANQRLGGASFTAGFATATTNTVARDDTGDTRFGRFGFSAHSGMLADFAAWLEKKGGPTGVAGTSLLRTGSAQEGEKTWQRLVKEGVITDDLQEEFVQEALVEPALDGQRPDFLEAHGFNPYVAKAVFSAASANPEAGAMLASAWAESGGDTEAFVKTLYAGRKEMLQGPGKANAAEIKRLEKEETALLKGYGQTLASALDTNAPGMVEPGNLDPAQRPLTRGGNSQGRSLAAVCVNVGGREMLLPVPDDGPSSGDAVSAGSASSDAGGASEFTSRGHLSAQERTDEDRALAQYAETGKHLGVFESPEAAEEYATALAARQADTASGTALANLSPETVDDLLNPREWAALAAESRAELKRQEHARNQEAAVLQEKGRLSLRQGLKTGDFGPSWEAAERLEELGRKNEATALKDTLGCMGLFRHAFIDSSITPLAEQERAVERAFSRNLRADNAQGLNQAYQHAQEETRERKAAFSRDPAGYVAGNPALAAEGMSAQDRVKASLALQQNVGKGLDFSPRVLTQDEVEKLGSQYFNAADPAARAKMLQETAAEYGPYALRAFAEAGLPHSALALGSVAAAMPPNLAARLLACAENLTGEKGNKKPAPDSNDPAVAAAQAAAKARLEASPAYAVLNAVAAVSFDPDEQQEFMEGAGATLVAFMQQGGRLASLNRYFGAVDAQALTSGLGDGVEDGVAGGAAAGAAGGTNGPDDDGPGQGPGNGMSPDGNPESQLPQGLDDNIGKLYAAADTGTATDASPFKMAASAPAVSPLSKEEDDYTQRAVKGGLYTEEQMRQYREKITLEQKRNSAGTKQEKKILQDKIDEIDKNLKNSLSYEARFSQAFRDDQEKMVDGWYNNITAPGQGAKFQAMMKDIDNTPPDQRGPKIEHFFSELAKAAGMPQTAMKMMSFREANVGGVGGSMATGKHVALNKDMFEKKTIHWESEIMYFFHEQVHEWQIQAADGRIQTSYADEVELLKRAGTQGKEGLYVYPRVSSYFYYNNPTELHAYALQEKGMKTFGAWKKNP